MTPRPVALALAVSVLACGIPRDPEGTLDRVRGGELRVGATHAEPWITISDPTAEPEGCEAELVRRLADELNAQVKWTIGSESQLLDHLKHDELDLVVGGIVDATPWKGKIGLTDDYHADEHGRHVLATPPGENAWIVALERMLRAFEREPSGWLEACR